MRNPKNNESSANAEENEIIDDVDEEQMLSSLNYCVFPQDEAKIRSIMASTVSLRTEILQSGKSIKKYFPIMIAYPKLVSSCLIRFQLRNHSC